MHSVEGGNNKLFKAMLNSANVSLDSTVTEIARIQGQGEDQDHFQVTYSKGGQMIVEEFDFVVLAAPLQDSTIKFTGIELDVVVDKYVRLYVTVVYGIVNPSYFGLSSQSQIPSTILTPKTTTSPFHCFSMRMINQTHSITKFFSNSPLSDKVLADLYLDKSQVYRQDWNHPGSYPKLTPFPIESRRRPLSVEIVPGLFFVNGFERLMSTMETESISGRNIALMIAQRINGVGGRDNRLDGKQLLMRLS